MRYCSGLSEIATARPILLAFANGGDRVMELFAVAQNVANGTMRNVGMSALAPLLKE